MIGGEPYTLGLFDTAGMSFIFPPTLALFCSSRISSLCNYYPLSHCHYILLVLWLVSMTLNGDHWKNCQLSCVTYHRQANSYKCRVCFDSIFILGSALFCQQRDSNLLSVCHMMATVWVKFLCVWFLQVRKTMTGYDLWVIPRQMSSSSVSPSCPPLLLKMSKKRQVYSFHFFLGTGLLSYLKILLKSNLDN